MQAKKQDVGTAAAQKLTERQMERIVVRLGESDFTKIQAVSAVRLRVFCPEMGSSALFMLRNAAGERRPDVGSLSMQVKTDMFLDMLNPGLKVVFQYNNVIAPFLATAVRADALLGVMPLSDNIRLN